LPACTSGKVTVYKLGLGDPRFTGNQQFARPLDDETARLCFIRGKDIG
jgi:hypothetical protein